MAGKQFTSRQEAQRYRQDRLTEIDEAIRQDQTGPQTARRRRTAVRQLQDQRTSRSRTTSREATT